MEAPRKLEMASPEGTRHMVLARDREVFERRGYTVIGEYPGEAPMIQPAPPAPVEAASPSAAPPPPPAPSASADQPLAKMTKAELIAIAEAKGLDTGGTNAQLVKRIQDAEAAAEVN